VALNFENVSTQLILKLARELVITIAILKQKHRVIGFERERETGVIKEHYWSIQSIFIMKDKVNIVRKAKCHIIEH
jgi:hypothetical protein